MGENNTPTALKNFIFFLGICVTILPLTCVVYALMELN